MHSTEARKTGGGKENRSMHGANVSSRGRREGEKNGRRKKNLAIVLVADGVIYVKAQGQWLTDLRKEVRKAIFFFVSSHPKLSVSFYSI